MIVLDICLFEHYDMLHYQRRRHLWTSARWIEIFTIHMCTIYILKRIGSYAYLCIIHQFFNYIIIKCISNRSTCISIIIWFQLTEIKWLFFISELYLYYGSFRENNVVQTLAQWVIVDSHDTGIWVMEMKTSELLIYNKRTPDFLLNRYILYGQWHLILTQPKHVQTRQSINRSVTFSEYTRSKLTEI